MLFRVLELNNSTHLELIAARSRSICLLISVYVRESRLRAAERCAPRSVFTRKGKRVIRQKQESKAENGNNKGPLELMLK